MDNKKIGIKIKNIRQKISMSQKQLAELWGVDQSLISKIENGERSVSLNQLEKLCNVSLIGMEYFFNDNDDSINNSIYFRTNSNNKILVSEMAVIGKIVKNIRLIKEILNE